MHILCTVLYFPGLSQSGIIVHGSSKSTELRSIVVNMDSPSGKSLILQKGSLGSFLHSGTFNGISDLGGDGGSFRSTVFSRVNLYGCGNTFESTMIQSLYTQINGLQCAKNMFAMSTMIGMNSNQQLQ